MASPVSAERRVVPGSSGSRPLGLRRSASASAAPPPGCAGPAPPGWLGPRPSPAPPAGGAAPPPDAAQRLAACSPGPAATDKPEQLYDGNQGCSESHYFIGQQATVSVY